MLLSRLLFVLFAVSGSPATTQVSLRFTSTAQAKGSIHLAVFDSEAALGTETPAWGEIIAVERDGFPFFKTLEQLPKGKIAIAVFHDLNGDGQLNRNLFGVPTEPYAFSGAPASKWRAPKWEEVAIDPSGLERELSLHMMFWKEQ